MDKKKSECDDAYWSSAHKGFDFDDKDWQPQTGDSKLSAVIRRNDELNQFDHLRCDGLTEIAENSAFGSAKDFLAFNLSQAESEKSASSLAKSFNPLVIQPKRQSISISGPEETVKNMILGLEYSFERYKGKGEKLELLNAAVKSHDGNAILAVVLFLRETLKKSIFQREIMVHPDAVNVYLAYLEEDHEIDELANMLLLLNKAEDAAILKYEIAVKVQHPERKMKWIENCLSTHFQLDATDIFLQQSVEEHRQLLDEQMKLEQYSHSNGNGILVLYEKLTGRKTVVDSSILCSLIFCCLCNYSAGELSFASPEKIKSNYNLSKKQYTWAILRALIASKRWLDIDDLFMSKNWLGGMKFRSCIACSRILEVLFKSKAPNEVLSKYVSCVETEDEKLILAKKYGCHSVVIEVLKNAKDRVGLVQYKNSLLPHSVDFCNATDILNNPVIRWKN